MFSPLESNTVRRSTSNKTRTDSATDEEGLRDEGTDGEFSDVFMQPVDAEGGQVHGLRRGRLWRTLTVVKPPRVALNRYVLVCALVACVSAALLGYDTGVMSGAILFIEEEFSITTFEKEVLVGSLNLVSIVGAAIAGRLSDVIGRRYSLAVAGMIFFVGASTMALAASYPVLLLGRIITGVGVGFSFTVAPVYTSELSPANSRGFLVALFEFCVNFGILLGYIASYALSTLPPRHSWRVMLGIGALPAIILGFSVLFLPESPRWLAMQGRTLEAHEVLARTSFDPSEVESRFQEILEATGQNIGGDSSASHGQGQDRDGSSAPHGDSGTRAPSAASRGDGVWRELLHPTRAVQRMLIVALGTNFFQQATGIDAIVYYSPSVFKEAGVQSKGGLLAATIMVGVTKSSFILLASFLLDHFGRRGLLLLSSAGMTISMFLIGIGFAMLRDMSNTRNQSLQDAMLTPGGPFPVPSGSPSATDSSATAASAIAITAVCVFAASFSIGVGPICWVLSSEIFPMRLRSQALGLATVVNRFTSGVVAMTFLSISEAITPAGCFFLFSIIGLLSVVFFYKYAPETKGKSLEEIERMFDVFGGAAHVPLHGTELRGRESGGWDVQRDVDVAGASARKGGEEPKGEREIQDIPLLQIARHDVEPAPGQ